MVLNSNECELGALPTIGFCMQMLSTLFLDASDLAEAFPENGKALTRTTFSKCVFCAKRERERER